MSNKSAGTAFEKEFAELLAEKGFWVHRLQDNQNGQPFDIIAVKNGRAYAFDCKDCAGRSFPLSRIEENQRMAMERWKECGNGTGYFAVHFVSSGTHILPLNKITSYIKFGARTLTEKDIKQIGTPLDSWGEDYAYHDQ